MLTVESIRLLSDLVLVDPEDRPDMSEGGIHIPETVARDNPNYYSMAGTVVKLGPGAPDAWYQCVTCERVGRESTGECPGCKLHLGGTNLRLFEHREGKRPFSVKVGDRVVFNRFAGKQFEFITHRRYEISGFDTFKNVAMADSSFTAGPERDGFVRLYNKNTFTTTYLSFCYRYLDKDLVAVEATADQFSELAYFGDTLRQVDETSKRMLVMHEYEILGTAEHGARVAPVYEAPTRSKITDGNRQGIEAPIP